MMYQHSVNGELTGTLLVHHATPLGVYQHHSFSMMHECNTGESLAGAALMHHAYKRS